MIPIETMQGDEVSLQKALNMVHKNNREYVAVLFYASWCPFSRIFRPVFSILSSLHPSIPHFAIEESSVRPRFVFSSQILSFMASINLTPIQFLQHIIKIWCPWFPYTTHFKFYHACSLSRISDPWLSHRFLQ